MHQDSQPERTADVHEGHLAELDGLRGVLSLWVAVSHTFDWCGFWDIVPPALFERSWAELRSASAAVSTFFILSGFAIASMLQSRPQSYRQFLVGRAFRIYPVYFVCLMLGWGSTVLTPFVLQTASWRSTYYFTPIASFSRSELAATPMHMLLHLSLLQGLVPENWLSNSSATLLAPGWSITVEWQYYLLAPLLLWLARSLDGVLVVALLAWLGVHYGAALQNPFPASVLHHLPMFGLGIASQRLYASLGSDADSRAWLSRAAIGLLGAALVVPWHAFALGGWAIAFGCMFARGDGVVARVFGLVRSGLRHPWTQLLGAISYPLYLVHWPLIIALLYGLLRWNPGTSSAQAYGLMMAIGLPVILLSAMLLHRFVEQPLMRLGTQLSQAAARPKAAANGG